MRSSFLTGFTFLALVALTTLAFTQEPKGRSTTEPALAFQKGELEIERRANRALDFKEIPGVRELSSRLIVRPYTRETLRDFGFSRKQIATRTAAARAELGRHDVIRHVISTDDSILIVPNTTTELELATRLMATGLFQYADPDWNLAPIQAVSQVHGTSKAQNTQVQSGNVDAGPTVTIPPRFPPLPPRVSNSLDVRAAGLPIIPNDPLFATQWHHQSDKLNSPAAWGIWGIPTGAMGGPHISIGVCDTGIRTTHEDLALHRLEGYNALSRLWESEGGSISSVNPHGTKTTGTAAANGNNGIGVSGVGWNLSHRMLRVSNISSGNAFLTDLQHAARTSIENGDRIANVSYHGSASPSNAGTATYIKSLGGLLVWGAGNTSSNYSSTDRDDDDIIVVGGTTQNDTLWTSSSYGTYIDLVAPSVGIVTSDAGSDTAYTSVNGTSYASPMTAGVCALIWSARPNLSPNDVERILKASTDDLGSPGPDLFFGYGRINLDRAMRSPWSAIPTADFGVTSATGVAPLATSFRDLSTGVPTSWLWDFGDGTTSTDQNPVHTYTSSGLFTVTLTARNYLGMHTATQVDSVIVDFIPPVADFTASVTGGLAPLPVQFTDTSTGGVPATWFWDFGDGFTSTLQDPIHTYVTSGFYTISMTATNAYGTDTRTQSNYVAVDFIPPVAAFSATPLTGDSPYVVEFTDESTAGVATSWSWTFGDGYGSTLQHPTHTYTVAGLYQVRLTVTNAYGSDTLLVNDYIEVLPGPTILANFTGTPTSGTAPLEVTFTDLSVGNIILWEWNFGDGTTSTLQNPTHIYTSADEYDVSLAVTNALGKDSCLELGGFVTVD